MQYVKRTTVILLTGGWLAVGCSRNNPTAEPLLNKPVSIAANQTERVGQDVTVEVERIQDSRCPANALCIRYGSADVAFTLTKGSDRQPGRLCLGECTQGLRTQDTTVVSVGGSRYRVVLNEVRPYPGTGAPDAKQEAVIRVLD